MCTVLFIFACDVIVSLYTHRGFVSKVYGSLKIGQTVNEIVHMPNGKCTLKSLHIHLIKIFGFVANHFSFI